MTSKEELTVKAEPNIERNMFADMVDRQNGKKSDVVDKPDTKVADKVEDDTEEEPIKVKKEKIVEKETVKDTKKAPKVEDLETKSKRLEKIAYDNHRFASMQQQKVKDTLKIINELVESGDLDDETSEKLTAHLKKESSVKSDDSFVKNTAVENPHILDKYKSMLNEDIFKTYVDVTDDADATKKLKAFDVYISEATDEEIESIDDELSGISNPMGLLKKILSIGNGFMEDGFGEFYNYNGFREFIKSKTESEKKLKKDIDKLNKKLLKYESESSSSNWLSSDSGGSENDKYKDSGNMFEDMVKRQNIGHKR